MRAIIVAILFCPLHCLNIMSQFSKKELSFVKEVPEQIEIECPICLHILTDPHLVSCCGYNFCGSCIQEVKASNGSCPMCKEKKYRTMVDKKCSRIINGLEVYCSNKEKGCQWKGELKNMSTHLEKATGGRVRVCQYEEVKCRHEKCQERKQRRYLKYHEDNECHQRPFECEHCGEEGTFLFITLDHYEECWWYPVTCPNKCVSTNMPRYSLTDHIDECPLEPVDCVFSWAGCNDKPLRKDVHVHTADTKHMTLLAVACGQLKKENEQIKQENEKIKKEVNELKATMKANFEDRTHCPDSSYPSLPIGITSRSKAVHFYTGSGGWHMSARIIIRKNLKDDLPNFFILLAFHEGDFDKFKPNLPEIFAKYKDKDIPLIVDTESTYDQLPYDVLDTITSCDDLPPGVIRRKKYNPFKGTVRIYAKY